MKPMATHAVRPKERVLLTIEEYERLKSIKAPAGQRERIAKRAAMLNIVEDRTGFADLTRRI